MSQSDSRASIVWKVSIANILQLIVLPALRAELERVRSIYIGTTMHRIDAIPYSLPFPDENRGLAKGQGRTPFASLRYPDHSPSVQ